MLLLGRVASMASMASMANWGVEGARWFPSFEQPRRRQRLPAAGRGSHRRFLQAGTHGSNAPSHLLLQHGHQAEPVDRPDGRCHTRYLFSLPRCPSLLRRTRLGCWEQPGRLAMTLEALSWLLQLDYPQDLGANGVECTQKGCAEAKVRCRQQPTACCA